MLVISWEDILEICNAEANLWHKMTAFDLFDRTCVGHPKNPNIEAHSVRGEMKGLRYTPLCGDLMDNVII